MERGLREGTAKRLPFLFRVERERRRRRRRRRGRENNILAETGLTAA